MNLRYSARIGLIVALFIFASFGAAPVHAAPTTAFQFSKNLQLRDTGPDVLLLQQFLNAQGFLIAQTGPGSPRNETTLFGLRTYRALAHYQKAHGLPTTGFFGPLTRNLISQEPSPSTPGPNTAAVAPPNQTTVGTSTSPATASTTSNPSTTTPWFALISVTPGYGGGGGGGDTTPPVMSGTPSDITAEATSASGATVNYNLPTATDNVDDTDSVSCSPTSGTIFAFGTTTVTCSATDKAGNSSLNTFSVTVRDTTAPSIGSTPSNVTTNATGPSGAVVTYTNPTATDLVDGSVSVSCLPSSGSTFPLGDNSVACSASDSHGNTANSIFHIIIQHPNSILTLPSDITAEATSTNGASVTFSATASDVVDGVLAVNCTPASGSTFALGTTTVNCSATNSASNTTSGSFHVIVRDTTSPTVSITVPSSGATVSGSSVTLSASASDTVGVAGVQFKVNGVNVGSEDTSSPYSISWDSTATSSGSKSIVAVARDAAGNRATSTAVTITVDNTAPSLSSISSGTPTDTTATITWTTNEAASSTVSYGLTTGYGSASSSPTLATSHSVTLTGLTAATTYHFQIQSADGQGNLATSSDQTFTTMPPANLHSSYIVADIPASATYYTFPGRIRPVEPQRTQLIVRNIGTTTIQLGPRATDNSNYNGPTSWTVTLTPGQEYADNGATTGSWFVRPNTSGQGGRYTVYVELNGTAGNGVAATRNLTAVPIAIPAFNVVAYGTATAQPIGISRDRATVYGTAGTGVLYQTVNDGSSWSSVHTFSENVVGLLETDDGEALCITQGGASVPGKVYKSSGWSTSHSAATWTLVLTSASGAFFRNYWDGGHFSSFGRDAINNSGKYGVIAEYGSQLNSGTDPTKPTHVYFTSNYGATWTQVLDLQARYPNKYPLHAHAAAYDPYWDRIWLTFGDTTFEGPTAASIIYSDDHGSTWTALTFPTEWQNVSETWQSTSIAILNDSDLDWQR